MIKPVYFLPFLLLFLASCEMVLFEKPAPEDVKAIYAIPTAFHGSYAFSSGSPEYGSITIGPDYIQGHDGEWERFGPGKWYVSDSLQVKPSGEDLVFNFRIDAKDGDIFWVAAIFQPPQCGFLKVFSFGSGFTEENYDLPEAPIITNHGASKMPQRGGYSKYYTMRADSATFEAMKADKGILNFVIAEKVTE